MGIFRWKPTKHVNDPRGKDRVGEQMTGKDKPPTKVPGFDKSADGVTKHYVSDQPGAQESGFGGGGSGGGG